MAHLFQVNRVAWSKALFCCSLSLLLATRTQATDAAHKEKEPKPARLKVSGYGLLGNYQLKHLLRTVELGGKKPELFDPAFVEDSAQILLAHIKRDGYLKPELTIALVLADGGHLEVEAESLLDNPLPRSTRIQSAHFKINKGVLYHFKILEFTGLDSITAKQARSYFVATDTLFHPKTGRIYTPQRVERGISSLQDTLDRQGFQEAKVKVAETLLDDKTGGAIVRIAVQQGPKYLIRSIRKEFSSEGTPKPEETQTVFPNKPYSKIWLQDFVQGIKTNWFHQGHPDTSVKVSTVQRVPTDGEVKVDLLAAVETGPQVRIGAVSFEGEKRTKRPLMARSVRVQRGELLDPVKIEEGRFRLAELGSFETVNVDYKPVDTHTRDVLFKVQEGRTLDLSLLFGYGSYELLRGGVEVNAYNIWGEGHNARLKVVQSFKASSGELTYTIPEFVGEDMDLFVNGNGLRREEPSFLRVEYGGGIGVHEYFKPIATDLTLRYNYEILNAFQAVPAIASEGLTNPAVGSIVIDIKHDKRDNPLYPTRGYKIFGTIETASEYLGGVANYERIEVAASWHHPLGNGLHLNLGLSQGSDISNGDPANNLPFNKRFFPGGADSIRGYQEDEASPRNAQGQIVGAETYTLANVELEQALTPTWSVVIFSDSLGFAERIQNYPWDTGLFSVGGGIRLKSFVGPIRLEYGYNLNPRPRDPVGTLQFSLGFPF
jgi:outer membrane protein assembly complex protein YaeT